MRWSWSDFRAGVRDMAPALPGPFTVALVASVAAVGAGLSTLQAYLLVGATFAGASQLAALELMVDGAAAAVVVLTALLINARFAIFSASLAPHFRAEPPRWRWLAGAVLSTPAAVLSLARFGDDRPVDRRSYYLGAALALWLVWQAGVVLGITAGARVPSELGLSFVVPLVFVGLLFSTISDRATAAAALVGGVAAVAGLGLPLDLGFLAGTFVGVAAGALVDRGWSR